MPPKQQKKKQEQQQQEPQQPGSRSPSPRPPQLAPQPQPAPPALPPRPSVVGGGTRAVQVADLGTKPLRCAKVDARSLDQGSPSRSKPLVSLEVTASMSEVKQQSEVKYHYDIEDQGHAANKTPKVKDEPQQAKKAQGMKRSIPMQVTGVICIDERHKGHVVKVNFSITSGDIKPTLNTGIKDATVPTTAKLPNAQKTDGNLSNQMGPAVNKSLTDTGSVVEIEAQVDSEDGATAVSRGDVAEQLLGDQAELAFNMAHGIHSDQIGAADAVNNRSSLSDTVNRLQCAKVNAHSLDQESPSCSKPLVSVEVTASMSEVKQQSELKCYHDIADQSHKHPTVKDKLQQAKKPQGMKRSVPLQVTDVAFKDEGQKGIVVEVDLTNVSGSIKPTPNTGIEDATVLATAKLPNAQKADANPSNQLGAAVNESSSFTNSRSSVVVEIEALIDYEYGTAADARGAVAEQLLRGQTESVFNMARGNPSNHIEAADAVNDRSSLSDTANGLRCAKVDARSLDQGSPSYSKPSVSVEVTASMSEVKQQSEFKRYHDIADQSHATNKHPKVKDELQKAKKPQGMKRSVPLQVTEVAFKDEGQKGILVEVDLTNVSGSIKPTLNTGIEDATVLATAKLPNAQKADANPSNQLGAAVNKSSSFTSSRSSVVVEIEALINYEDGAAADSRDDVAEQLLGGQTESVLNLAPGNPSNQIEAADAVNDRSSLSDTANGSHEESNVQPTCNHAYGCRCNKDC